MHGWLSVSGGSVVVPGKQKVKAERRWSGLNKDIWPIGVCLYRYGYQQPDVCYLVGFRDKHLFFLLGASWCALAPFSLQGIQCKTMTTSCAALWNWTEGQPAHFSLSAATFRPETWGADSFIDFQSALKWKPMNGILGLLGNVAHINAFGNLAKWTKRKRTVGNDAAAAGGLFKRSFKVYVEHVEKQKFCLLDEFKLFHHHFHFGWCFGFFITAELSDNMKDFPSFNLSYFTLTRAGLSLHHLAETLQTFFYLWLGYQG